MTFQRILAVMQIVGICFVISLLLPAIQAMPKTGGYLAALIFLVLVLGIFAVGSVLIWMGTPLGRRICIAAYALQIFSVANPIFVWKLVIPAQAGFYVSMPGEGEISYGFAVRLATDIQFGIGGPPEMLISINLFAVFMVWLLWKRYKTKGQSLEIDRSIFQ